MTAHGPRTHNGHLNMLIEFRAVETCYMKRFFLQQVNTVLSSS